MRKTDYHRGWTPVSVCAPHPYVGFAYVLYRPTCRRASHFATSTPLTSIQIVSANPAGNIAPSNRFEEYAGARRAVTFFTTNASPPNINSPPTNFGKKPERMIR